MNGAVVESDLEVVSLGQLRAAVRRLLTSLSGIAVEDAVQVCDELASNAVVHARAPRGCRLTVAGHGGWLRVEVEDASPAPARIRRPDHTGGRGLILGVYYLRGLGRFCSPGTLHEDGHRPPAMRGKHSRGRDRRRTPVIHTTTR
ncbi:ATP-binding protein [Nocardia beijingensis]|uniref:ATP-binding protein n=1 Tax=Nocardia beijingensis TaxID=95162 RepID=UPI0018932D56|nr:ATP-binding protein [Nocardia beijingensis]MBF6074272.1 ATP-binding protein [Nocardia beijingensis]